MAKHNTKNIMKVKQSSTRKCTENVPTENCGTLESENKNVPTNVPSADSQCTKFFNKTISVVFNRKKTASAKKSASVDIRVAYQGKSYFLATGIKCKLHEFKDGKVIKRLDMDSCNETIGKMLDGVRTIVGGMENISADLIRERLTALNSPKVQMPDWFFKRAEERNMKASTRRQHLVAIRYMLDCGIFHNWDDITLINLQRFDELLHQRVQKQTTIHSYHKRLKPYFADALLLGYIPTNPYANFKVPRGKSERIAYLTEDEVRRIEVAVLPNDCLCRVRDLFLFQCYTGLAYADASSLTKESFVESNNTLYIISRRQKTESDIAIRVLNKAKAILEKYDYELPWISLEKYNLYLKALAAHCDISKRLTSHMGRHTFATTALHNGIRIEVVSKMLSHSDIKTTQIYAKVLAEDVMAAFDVLDEK